MTMIRIRTKIGVRLQGSQGLGSSVLRAFGLGSGDLGCSFCLSGCVGYVESNIGG